MRKFFHQALNDCRLNGPLGLLILGLWCLMVAAPFARAETFRPLIVYQGNIKDNSFNQTLHEGVATFSSRTGIPCKEDVTGLTQAEYLADLEKGCVQGYSPVFLVYGNHFEGLAAFIHRFPETRFVAFGSVIDEPNLFCVDFAEEEGSFMAGALAALATKTGTIGFVSVTDVPLMRRFSCGYEQGARYVNPEIKVLSGFIGAYPGSWFDGVATARMANQFMDQGADVIYQAAGGGGPAVLEAVAKRGRLGIGVDRNQNGLYPGHVLSSMVKRSDKVIFAALTLAHRGVWRDNIKRFGLAQEAVGLVFDANNAKLVTSKDRETLELISTKILLGEIKVHDYVVDNECP